MAYGSFGYGSSPYGGGLKTVRTIRTRPGRRPVILSTRHHTVPLFTIKRPILLVSRKQMAVL